MSRVLTTSLPSSMQQPAFRTLESVRVTSEYAGWFLGLSSKWVMFAPPNRENWKFEHIGGTGSSTRPVATSSFSGERRFIQRNFLDFREAKYELNTYGNVTWQRNLAAHLCIREVDLDWIELQVSWIPMISFEEVTPGTSYQERFERKVLHASLGRYDCPPFRR